jgi:sulfite reductase (NADPH) flavoprotein alpha-component
MSLAYDRHHPFLARIAKRELLSKEGSTRNTWHIVLDIQGSALRYQPGQSVAILPENEIEEVQEILAHFSHCPESEVELLKEKLSREFDIRRPSQRLKDKVKASQEGEDDVLSLLQQSSERFSTEEFLACLRPLLPRFYSIASSQLKAHNQLHLVVLEVAYEWGGKKKKGVASSYLARRCPLEKPQLAMYLQPSEHFRLPASVTVPIIMIGAGTGIAPFRAFLEEREQHGAPRGVNWLFFGERHRKCDFFFEELLLDHVERLGLRLDLAFSRDSETKEYVIHKMEKEKATMIEWLEQGAHLYVSGSLERLGKSVEKLLQSMATEKFQGDALQGRQWIQTLRREKRYLQDIY